MAGRLTSAGCQFIVLWLFTTGGVGLVVGSVIGAQLLLAVVVWVMHIETNGRRLEEVTRSDTTLQTGTATTAR